MGAGVGINTEVEDNSLLSLLMSHLMCPCFATDAHSWRSRSNILKRVRHSSRVSGQMSDRTGLGTDLAEDLSFAPINSWGELTDTTGAES